MNKLITELNNYGADIKGAMARFVDDEELYISCFASFLEDPYFDGLGKALEEGDFEEAFNAAHTLKGVAGNMGLTPLYDKIGDVVELLRNKEVEILNEPYQKVLEDYQVLKTLQE